MKKQALFKYLLFRCFLYFLVKPDTVLAKDVTLLVLGEYKALQKCFRL